MAKVVRFVIAVVVGGRRSLNKPIIFIYIALGFFEVCVFSYWGWSFVIS